MAEGLFRAAIKDKPDIDVNSAGVATGYGQPPSPHAVEVLKPWGIDITGLRSQPLTDDLVEEATHIIVMTRGHKEAIEMYFPEASHKVYLFRQFDDTVRNGNLDVPDPIGLGIHAYFECRDTLKRGIPGILRFLDQSKSTMSSPQPTPTTSSSTPSRTLRIALGADHGGFELKKAIHAHLTKKGYVVTDFGVNSTESADYPDYAEGVAKHVLAGESDFGILACKSGIGMSVGAKGFRVGTRSQEVSVTTLLQYLRDELVRRDYAAPTDRGHWTIYRDCQNWGP